MTDQLVIYRCAYSDCSNEGIERPVLETDGPIPADDPRRRCEGSVVLIENDLYTQAQCFRPLDRVDPGDGSIDHVEAPRPEPEPLPPDDLAPGLWLEVKRVAGLQITQTDRYIEPFPVDMDETFQAECAAHETEWYAFRQGLRDLATADETGDPAALVWPTLPAAPGPIVISAPPGFVDSSAWPEYIAA